ncbi:3-oxoacyl-[acyl-carrier-protein] reductase [Desulfoferrobacter suflitae]|uniref:3-oxoacyl-[acyl-carrier-protein] reductase n=1 Tax=Desulfoferrobacter suflitae TaxID=2865782 RepID=UPI0021647FFE|nr:3-oxoacyl-[acyl-carrier-protein] reductase [Desulfoferrobacter suflitae]MCK8601921.1 3-oxoacyl-[acyl-carrier-protein] reductase [Desulfoferrobacter suflitae]
MSEKRVIVVTGASRGIGRAIAVELAEPGHQIVINYRSGVAAAQKTAAAVADKGGGAHLQPFDIADETAVKEAFKEMLKAHGRIDVLVNNAGITRDNLLVLMKSAEWDEVIDTNLKGAFLCSQAVVKPMMRQKYGRIVNVTSVVGAMGNAGQSNYAAAKAGIIGLTRSLARELISRNITVNAVAPGFIETDMTAALTDKAKESLLAQIPAARLGTPEDVAGAVKYLASEAAGYVTGQVVHVNGGMFMG